jgi:uncharacterized protein with HEPN domain
MQPKVEDRLLDILEVGESIQGLTAGLSFDEYRREEILRLAVERQLITVGEALNVALQLDPALRNQITEAREIIAFRNILVHNYSSIRHDKVWTAITIELPLLLAQVRALLPPAP